MKQLTLILLFISLFFSSCELILGRRIKGDGTIASEKRTIAFADKIKLAGSFDVELVNGTTPSVTIETDENILPYLVTRNENDWLVIRSKKHCNLIPSNKIKVIVTTNQLESVTLAGSGNIFSNDKFSTSSAIELKIAGSGDATLLLDAPKILAEIAGSGNINLSGETKDLVIKIAGHGDFKGENLKSENASVHIAGSGNVRVFADNKLDVHIAGSGDVYYKGKATVEQHIAGSGTIKQLQ